MKLTYEDRQRIKEARSTAKQEKLLAAGTNVRFDAKQEQRKEWKRRDLAKRLKAQGYTLLTDGLIKCDTCKKSVHPKTSPFYRHEVGCANRPLKPPQRVVRPKVT